MMALGPPCNVAQLLYVNSVCDEDKCLLNDAVHICVFKDTKISRANLIAAVRVMAVLV